MDTDRLSDDYRAQQQLHLDFEAATERLPRHHRLFTSLLHLLDCFLPLAQDLCHTLTSNVRARMANGPIRCLVYDTILFIFFAPLLVPFLVLFLGPYYILGTIIPDDWIWLAVNTRIWRRGLRLLFIVAALLALAQVNGGEAPGWDPWIDKALWRYRRTIDKGCGWAGRRITNRTISCFFFLSLTIHTHLEPPFLPPSPQDTHSHTHTLSLAHTHTLTHTHIQKHTHTPPPRHIDTNTHIQFLALHKLIYNHPP